MVLIFSFSSMCYKVEFIKLVITLMPLKNLTLTTDCLKELFNKCKVMAVDK